MRSLKKIIALLMLAALMTGLAPTFAYAAKNDAVKLTVSSTLFVTQGQSSHVDVEAEAPEDIRYKLVLSCDDPNIVIDGSSGILNGNAKQSFSFTVSKKAETGYKTLVLKAVDADNATKVYAERSVYVDVVENINSFSSQKKAAFEVSYTITGSDSLIAGEVNFLRLTLFNRGSNSVRNAKVEITMPEGMTIQSGPAGRNIGSFYVGETNTVDWPVLIDKDMKTGSYPISVRLTGEYGGEDLESVEAIYIPLVGKDKEEDKDDSVPLLIVDSFDYGKGVLKRGADFTLKLTFLNAGTRDIHNVVVNVLEPTGQILPKESTVIKIDSIKAGEKADASIALRTSDNTDGTQATLAVDMKYYDPDNRPQEGTYPIIVSLEKKEDEKKEGVTNPILMVTNYGTGGDGGVLAGSDFPLSLTITNTSAKTLRNIKVTVTDSAGAILPSQGSNSFFINSIAPGASYGKLMPMSVDHSAPAGNDAIAVNMSYEELDGSTHTSADTITVPIRHEDRLVIDEILDPGWLVAGEQGYVQIKYYNMGQTTLNNLRISVSGDFAIDGDSSQYVGNMANGRSDYFSFNFVPLEEGTSHGKAVFTYENGRGEEQIVEKEFSFNVQPAPVWDDPGMDMPIEPAGSGFPIVKVLLIAAAVIGAIIGIAAFRKHRKAKSEALELDE